MLEGDMAIGALMLARLVVSQTVLAIIAAAAGLGVVLLAFSVVSVGRRRQSIGEFRRRLRPGLAGRAHPHGI